MKCLAIVAVTAAALMATPAFASGKNGLAVGLGLGVSTGKGGLAGSLLGGSKGKSNGIGVATNVQVQTGKGGVLGTLLGNSSSKHGRGGHHGGW